MDAIRSLNLVWRSLTRSPGYVATFVLTLGLAIGANTAIFSVVEGVLLEPLPHEGGERLVHLRQTAVVNALPDATWSVPEIQDYREAATTVEGLAEFSALTFTMLGHDEPRRVRAGIVSGNYFDVMGLDPVAGRLFGPDDDGRRADPVMVLTHEFWLRRFGGAADAVGRTVRMNGRTITIVGVLEPAPHYPERTDVFVNTVSSPHHMSAAMSDDRLHRMTQVFGRVAPGASHAEVASELSGICARLALEYPDAYDSARDKRVSVTPLVVELTHRARPTFLVLMATAGFVLLIACANVTNLTLVRVLHRDRELSMRHALGASRFRLRGLVVVENLLLALGGAVLGLAVTHGVFDLLVAYAARFTPRAIEITLDAGVFLIALVIACGTAALAALAPPVAVGSDPRRGGTVVSAARRLQRLLAVAQVALAFVLVTGAGLLTRTLVALNEVETGYAVESVLTMDIPTSRLAGRSRSSIVGFYDEILRRVERLAGVRSAAVTSSVPLSGAATLLEVGVEGFVPDDPRASAPRADYRAVSPGYFEALSIPLIAGRRFTASDDAESPSVVIINESMARYYFPDRDPVGRWVRWTDDAIRFIGIDGGERTVIGVVADTLDQSLEAAPPHVVYQPFGQEPWAGSLVVRTHPGQTASAGPIVDIIRELDAEQPVENVRTLAEIQADTVAPRRLNASLVALFAGLALTIAAIGVFGVLGFSVSQRRREFGIRASLGASARSILGSVMAEGLRIQLVALVVGLGGSWVLARFLRGLLFGVEPFDPVTFALALGVVTTVGAIASWAPASLAAKTNPVDVLRAE